MYKALLFNPVLNNFTPSGTHETLELAISRIKCDLWRVRKDVPFYGIVVNPNNYSQVYWDSRQEQS